MGENTEQAQQWLRKCYPDCIPSKTTICRWYADFKRGRTDTNDAKRSGRPNEAVTPENIKQVLKIVMGDRKLNVREITKMVKISTESASTILNEKLGMKRSFPNGCRVFSQWNKSNNESTIHHFTPESKRQSAEWRTAGESRPKRPKTQQSAGKVMASVFWDAHSIIYIDYLEKGKYINSDYYIELLVRLKDEIAKKRLHMKKKKIIFHQDNAPCHKSMKTMTKLSKLGYEMLPHPP